MVLDYLGSDNYKEVRHRTIEKITISLRILGNFRVIYSLEKRN